MDLSKALVKSSINLFYCWVTSTTTSTNFCLLPHQETLKEAQYKNYCEYRIEKHCTSSYALPGTHCTAAATAAAVALLH